MANIECYARFATYLTVEFDEQFVINGSVLGSKLFEHRNVYEDHGPYTKEAALFLMWSLARGTSALQRGKVEKVLAAAETRAGLLFMTREAI